MFKLLLADGVSTAVTGSLAGTAAESIALIASVAVVAFGIKAGFIAWRTGSKAVSKTGS